MAPYLSYYFRDAQGSVYLLQSNDIGRIEQRVKLVKKRPFIALALIVGQGAQQLFQGVPKLVPAITKDKEMLTHFKIQTVSELGAFLIGKYLRNISGDRLGTDLPVRVPRGSIHSQSRIWPGGRLRRGPVSTKLIHSYTGFIGTC